MVEQHCPYPELDGRDLEPGTVHLWAERDGAPVAYLRILHEARAARIGRVCTDAAHRGAGHSARLRVHISPSGQRLAHRKHHLRVRLSAGTGHRTVTLRA